MPFFFDISRYLRDKYFDIIWGYHSPRDPPKWTPPKARQQFEINEFYVCTNFRGNQSRDFGFMTRKPPRKFGVKSGLSQKRLKYGKKYFSWLYVLRYPFIPTNPLSAAMRFFSYFFPFFSFFFLFFPFFFLFFPFFSFFFFLNLVRSSSPKPQNIEI